jgi:hypothetical protein
MLSIPLTITAKAYYTKLEKHKKSTLAMQLIKKEHAGRS